MRSALLVSLLAGLLSVPAQAAYFVELTTGETLTVQSYWRDGDDVHLVRGGGLEIIVKDRRIKRLESGAPEPDLVVESASTRGPAKVAEDAAVDLGDDEAAETLDSYGERLGEMTAEELEAEEERATNALLAAQAARFEAQYGGKSPEDVKRLRERFKGAQARERIAETRLKELAAE
jgi:hypothetical protein